jgi:hypothetical protein
MKRVLVGVAVTAGLSLGLVGPAFADFANGNNPNGHPAHPIQPVDKDLAGISPPGCYNFNSYGNGNGNSGTPCLDVPPPSPAS